MLSLKLPHTWPLVCHKAVTTCHIDSKKVSNSIFTPDLCNCVRNKTIEATGSLQQPPRRRTMFWDKLYAQLTCSAQSIWQKVFDSYSDSSAIALGAEIITTTFWDLFTTFGFQYKRNTKCDLQDLPRSWKIVEKLNIVQKNNNKSYQTCDSTNSTALPSLKS